VPGELYIGGEGVARGYLGRPELTAERFVPDPFDSGRLYRTGDKVRWFPDGRLEFLGRIDHQAKIRGFRIELGEIEAVLAAHDAVREVVVLAREDQPGDKRLVAYMVGREGPLDVEALRAHVGAKLPEYMMPSAFVALDALPLTPNGKMDRKALPVPELGALTQRAYVAPRTEVEQLLAGLWCQLLRVERVGIDDNFFELGGHSLLVMQLVARVRQTLSVELKVRAVFEAPTLGGLAEVIGRTAGETAPPLVPVARGGELEASFGQQRFWVLAQLAERDAYDMSQALRLRGALDAEALARAMDALVARHEVLRTTLAEVDGRVMQRIAPARAGTMAITEVGSYDEAHAYCRAQREQTFDLTTGPLFAPALVRISAVDHVLMLRMHHVVGDEWSLNVLYRELFALYEGRELAPLAVQYADFAAWQRAWLVGDVLEQQLAYWRTRLKGAASLELPTDRPRPPVLGTRGYMVERSLSASLGHAMEALGRAHNATPFMTWLAAFYVLLHRYSHQDDISVGAPVANRGRVETDALVGYFVNTVVLRADLSGTPSFSALLAQVRDIALGAYAHQDIPFDRVFEALQLPRDLARTPLFQVMFVHQRGGESAAMPGFATEGIDLGTTTSKFDLTLLIVERSDSVTCAVELNTDLFDVRTIERMLEQFQTLLEGIVVEPSRSIGELELLTPSERQRLLVDWNATDREYPSTLCLHELFEAQTDRSPDAIAVVCEGAQLNYGELDRRANQLAHHLRSLGVGPEVRVGICVRRSLEMVVSVLGVLKAGGAYVPLDANYPAERLAFMLHDAGTPVVIAHAAMAARVTPPGLQVTRIDIDRSVLDGYPTTRPERQARLRQAAYVIYTSGTTGRPKGVVVEHHMAVNQVTGLGALEAIQPSDRVLQFTSLSFDPSVQELFTPLAHGATVVVRGEDVPTADELLGPRFAGVTILNLTTAYWHALTPEALPPSLRMVVFGGERALPAHVRTWSALSSKCQVLNLYGPTETTVAATGTFLRSDDLLPGREVPIGAPLANYKVYVLDANRQVVPIGVPGELYIGGVGVARGYLHRPELTAEKFVANPYGPGILYRTGDKVRWFPDGRLEFMGRIDHQVKIRGFRIELGEIEAVLAAHATVREAVVVAREDAPGNKRLVAYVVGRAGLPDVDTLRAHVSAALPEYMVPAAFVALDALPLTPNGKLDREALPAPEQDALAQREYIAPRTEAERLLAAIWSELLGIERVGAHDNFFALGGHSLLAIQAVTRVRARLGVSLPLVAMFQAGTIEALACLIEKLSPTASTRYLVPFKAAHVGTPSVVAVHPIHGTVEDYASLGDLIGRARGFDAFEARGVFGGAVWTSVPEMAAHYARELIETRGTGPVHLLGWSFGSLVVYEMRHHLMAAGVEVLSTTLLDAQGPSLPGDPPGDPGVEALEALAGGLGLELRPDELARPREEVLAMFAERARAAGNGGASVEVATYDTHARVIEAHVRAAHSYVAAPTDTRIVLINARDAFSQASRTERWRRYVPNLEVLTSPGTHGSMLQPPHVEALYAILDEIWSRSG
ncbi:MAG: amino acid adenylation domain-containing protein, partial [Kofleriaceae bacterium]|nr:amino acid adenylation domain-containing protein [Kofleriaceae bacterium]